jgi:hypothetical protein
MLSSAAPLADYRLVDVASESARHLCQKASPLVLRDTKTTGFTNLSFLLKSAKSSSALAS